MNRTLYPSQSFGSSRIYLEFQFVAQGAGTSVPQSAVDGANAVTSITHVAGTNKFTVNLQDTFNRLISISATVAESTAAGAGAYATAGNVRNEASQTPISFDVYTWNADGTPLDDPTSTIMLFVAFRNGYWGVK
ncbi:MAG: hypothetical protein FWD69_10140 [Polyangiaceae bacterium]|nr:hypothetical protein [Polyangiaceae bacterium]